MQSDSFRVTLPSDTANGNRNARLKSFADISIARDSNVSSIRSVIDLSVRRRRCFRRCQPSPPPSAVVVAYANSVVDDLCDSN